MKRSILKELPVTRDMIDVFGGYNHNLRIREGEFFDMENLTSADYPVLSPRHKRGIYTFPTLSANPICLASKDALCYVDDGDKVKLYINKYKIAGLVKRECKTCDVGEYCPYYIKDLPNCNRSLISMGSYLIIMPEANYINTNDYSDKGGLSSEFVCYGEGAKATFSLCKLDGSDYNATPQVSAPPNPQNLDLWIDTSSTPHVLKQYAATTEQWVSIPTTYIKIKAVEGDGKNVSDSFEVGDGITIKGVYRWNNKTGQMSPDVPTDLNSTMVIQAKGDDYIVVIGMLDKTYEQNCSPNDEDYDSSISFTRDVPAMDFVIEAGNRLWGCRYGLDNNGNYVNEIYASKLGDFKNWNCFAGISTDSYVASVGTDGPFTGAITYLGYPIFFKENYIHKVYGNFPANFQIQTTACRGVQKGCSKSIAIVNETLYYKSRSAVCAYDGSLPVEISSPLGDVAYSDAVAGVLGNKYYISMKDSEDYHLFVYDAAKSMWHREDNTQAVQFCNCRGNLYYIDYADKKIKMIREEANEDTETDPIKWKAITGVIGTDSPDKKYISSLVVRIKLEVGTVVRFSAEYDSSGEFEHLFTMSGKNLQSFSIPIRPKRCDHLRLKIEGQGMAKIYSITKTIEQGSDV